ncbi:DUF2497 domain-containing protein [Alphaproteobacteria bacterium]
MVSTKQVNESLNSIRELIAGNIFEKVNSDILELSNVVPTGKTETLNSIFDNASINLSSTETVVEGVVKNILEKELKYWLNANLPTIVREVVEKEIQKIIRQYYTRNEKA